MTALLTDNLPVFLVILPLFVGFVLPTLARRLRLVENLVIFAQTLGLFGAVYLAFFLQTKTDFPFAYALGGWPAPWGIELFTGNLAAFFLLVITGVTLPIALFAKGNLGEEVGEKGRVARFYVLFLLLCGALAGMALTNDLFNVFVLVEVATLSCCGLVSAAKNPRASEAAFTYLILATLGSTFVLGGIGFLYITTGHLNMGFAAQGLHQAWQNSPHVIWLAASFMLIGFGVKSALFPLHTWLPDAHSMAPAPASAILSGLAVKGYLICLLKVIYDVFGADLILQFNLDKILTSGGMIAIIVGSIMALGQSELKRRLAYSTVAQIGYIVLGFGLFNTIGLAGALFYLASHAVIKSALFLSAGTMVAATGQGDLKSLAGIGRKMPLTTGVFTVASLGLVGIPLFSGFIGKWHLLLGGLEAENVLIPAVIIIGSVLCAAYLFPVLRTVYFESGPENNWRDPGLAQKIALILLAVAVIGLGVIPGPFMNLARKAAAELLVLP